MTSFKNICIICVTSAMLLTACASSSRVVVRDRPVVVRPAPPYPGAVWITEEYAGRPGRYRYVAPHYVRSRSARDWVPGYWRDERRGKVWVKGHWR